MSLCFSGSNWVSFCLVASCLFRIHEFNMTHDRRLMKFHFLPCASTLAFTNSRCSRFPFCSLLLLFFFGLSFGKRCLLSLFLPVVFHRNLFDLSVVALRAISSLRKYELPFFLLGFHDIIYSGRIKLVTGLEIEWLKFLIESWSLRSLSSC